MAIVPYFMQMVSCFIDIIHNHLLLFYYTYNISNAVTALLILGLIKQTFIHLKPTKIYLALVFYEMTYYINYMILYIYMCNSLYINKECIFSCKILHMSSITVDRNKKFSCLPCSSVSCVVPFYC